MDNWKVEYAHTNEGDPVWVITNGSKSFDCEGEADARWLCDTLNAKQIWWCRVHNREATYVWNKPGFAIHGKVTCHPDLGGIMTHCRCEPIDKPAASK